MILSTLRIIWCGEKHIFLNLAINMYSDYDIMENIVVMCSCLTISSEIWKQKLVYFKLNLFVSWFLVKIKTIVNFFFNKYNEYGLLIQFIAQNGWTGFHYVLIFSLYIIIVLLLLYFKNSKKPS